MMDSGISSSLAWFSVSAPEEFSGTILSALLQFLRKLRFPNSVSFFQRIGL